MLRLTSLLAMSGLIGISACARAQTLHESLNPAPIRAITGDEHARADVPLAQIVEQAESRLSAPPAGADEPERDPLDPRAARLYARGRLLLLDGQAAPAVSALRRAAEFAPESTNAWRELGMAQAAINDVASARRSLEKALELGSREPRVLYTLARIDLAQGHQEAAIDRLAQASTRDPARQDDALPALILVALGEALHASGYVRAGNEAITQGVEAFDRVRNRSSFGAELTRVYPRRGRLLRIVADNWLRLDEPGLAADAYARAWELGAPINDAIMAKHVLALVRDGRSDEAVDRLLDGFHDPASRLDKRLILAIDLLDAAGRAEASERLAEALDEPWVDRTLRGWLMRARAKALGGERGRAVLRSRLAEAPLDVATLRALMATFAGPDELGRELADLQTIAPVLVLEAGAIVAIRSDAPEVVTALAERPGAEANAARASLLLAMSQPAPALQAINERGAENALDAALSAMAPHAMGRLDAALRSLDRTEGMLRAWTLRAIQRPRASAESVEDAMLGEAWAMEFWLDAAPEDMLRERGEAIARRLLELDPSNLAAIEVLARLAPETGGELIRDRASASRLRRLIAAERALATGERDEAELALTNLALEGGPSDRALDLLVSIWLSARGIDRELALERGVALLGRLLEERAGDVPLVIARARLLETRGEQDAAQASLRESLGFGASVRRELEAMLLRDPRSAERGRELRDARLAQQDLTIGERIERAAELVDAQDVQRAARLLSDRELDGISLTVAQSGMIAPSLRRLGARISGDPRGPERDATIALLDRLVGLDASLVASLHELRLALLATLEPVSHDRIAKAVQDAAVMIGQTPVDRTALAPVRFLISEQRLGEALGLLEAIADEIELRDTAGIDLWIRLVASEGGPENLRLLLERVQDDAALRAVFSEGVTTPIDELTGGALRGEIAFIIGVQHAAAGREDDAMGDYAIGLEYDPNHPWCANNLGYTLLERGEQIERAERLIEIAHEQLPDNDSILDSLGWARYLRGQIHDEPGLDGQPPRLGAVSLLERAVELGGEDGGAVVLDHLGDALWRADETERAIARWKQALDAARKELSQLADQLGDAHPTVVESRELEASLQAKIDAGERGEPPAIAPIPSE